MLYLKKLSALALIIMVSMLSLYAQNNGIQVGAAAPEFTMYEYKDKTFTTDDYYGKKIVTYIFGSIT